MGHGVNNKTGISFLVVALAAILVLGGVMAACSRATTTTSAPAPTSTSVTTRTITSSLSTTTSAPATTSTSVPSTTTSAPAPTSTGVSAADFYKANVVTVIVPYGPGATTDYAARLFANYWTEVTGGRMIVENKAGAGGLLGANLAYAAKPDGLTIGEGIPGSGLTAPVLAQDPAVKFDLKKMNWIEFINGGDPDGLVVGAKSPYTSMQDLLKVNGLIFASPSTRYGTGTLGAALVIELFGLKDARIVLGYASAADASLAVGKGEADAFTMTSSTLKDGTDKGLTKQSFLTLGFQRSPHFPDAPTIPELLKLSPEQENLLKTFAALKNGQVFWLAPGVPQDRIDFVRNAFDKIVVLEGFMKQSALKWIYVPPVSGKDFAAEMEKILAVVTPERFNELKALVDKYTR